MKTACPFVLLRRATASTAGLGLALVSGVAVADVCFYRHPSGWTGGAFLAWVGLVLQLRPAPATRRTAMRWSLLALVVAAGAVAYCGGVLGTSLAMVSLACMAAARLAPVPWHADEWLFACGRALLAIPTGWFRDQRLLRRRHARSRTTVARIPRLVLAWLVPLLLAAIFVRLFYAANPVIERGVLQAVEVVAKVLKQVALPEFLRVAFWLFLALSLWGLWRIRGPKRAKRPAPRYIPTPAAPPPLPLAEVALRVLPLQPSHLSAPSHDPTPQTPPPQTLSDVVLRVRAVRPSQRSAPPNDPAPLPPRPPRDLTGMALRCLLLFNLLFAVETIVDLLYLWGGRTLPAGMSYASYAHRGAYPLIATALLSAAITLFFFRPGGPTEQHAPARYLVQAWLAQNILLTVSAAWRLHLYVGVYTLTELRVATFVWMTLVGVGLVALVLRIARRRTNRWLLDINTAALLIVLFGCAWWPIPEFVASYNVRHCRENAGPGPLLDLQYLRELGPAALPALRAYAQIDGAKRAEATLIADELQTALHTELQNPRTWSWRKAQLVAQDKIFSIRDAPVTSFQKRNTEGSTP